MLTETIEKAAIAHQKLKLYADIPEGHNRSYTSLVWDYYKGHPRITVWSREPKEEHLTGTHNGETKLLSEIPIEVRSSYPRLKSFVMSMIKNINNTDPWTKHFITYQPLKDANGKINHDEKVKCTVVHYGRDKEGYLYIRVHGVGREPVKFRLMEDKYHTSEGEYTTPIEESNFIATGYFDSIKKMLDSGFEKTYDPDFRPWAKDS